jgi:vacuolar-type H+-ATPase subunit H
MNISSTSQATSTPLEQIRQAEVEISRQIAIARKSAEKLVADAQLQADRLKEKALEDGHIAGQKAAEEYLAQIHSEVSRMIVQAQIQTEESCRHGFEHINEAVEYAILFVIGLPTKGEEK